MGQKGSDEGRKEVGKRGPQGSLLLLLIKSRGKEPFRFASGNGLQWSCVKGEKETSAE